MKIKGFAVFFVILAAGGFMLFKQQSQNTDIAQNEEPSANPISENRFIKSIPSQKEIESFDLKLIQEVSKISDVDEDPQRTEERLRDFSKGLSDKEIRVLYDSILNLKKPQDERFLAVTLLSWSQKTEVADLLESIAISETDPFLSTGRNAEFEAILRMKAVEGLSDLPLSITEHQRHLQNIIRKSSSAQVSDRAQRSLWAMAGEADRPEVQDEKALAELLEKSSKSN